MLLETIEPRFITDPEPIFIPGPTIHFAPIHTFEPISIGL